MANESTPILAQSATLPQTNIIELFCAKFILATQCSKSRLKPFYTNSRDVIEDTYHDISHIGTPFFGVSSLETEEV
jgi:hypothetical protein